MDRFTALYYDFASQTDYNFMDSDAISKLEKIMKPLMQDIGYEFDALEYFIAQENFRTEFWREKATENGYAELANSEYLELSTISMLHNQRCQTFAGELGCALVSYNNRVYSTQSRIQIVNPKSKFDNLEAGKYKAYNRAVIPRKLRLDRDFKNKNYTLKTTNAGIGNQKLLSGSEWNDYFKQTYGSKNVEWVTKNNNSFGSRDLLEGHFQKHGNEFGGIYSSADEYLQGARDVMNNGYKVQYEYNVTDKWGMKVPEQRTGYIKFMGNSKKGEAKFEFVGTNNRGDITTYHTESGKSLWKLLNGSNTDKTINPIK